MGSANAGTQALDQVAMGDSYIEHLSYGPDVVPFQVQLLGYESCDM